MNKKNLFVIAILCVLAFLSLYGTSLMHESGKIGSLTTTLISCVILLVFIGFARKFRVEKSLDNISEDIDNSNLPQSEWSNFLENSPIAIALLNTDSTIRETNSAFCNLVGKERGECAGCNFLEIADEEGRKNLESIISGEEIGKPVDVGFADNSEVSAMIYINKFNDGKKDGLIAYMIDTSEQKNLEMRFVHSQKMQAVGQLAGGIAHDFNNLLTAMIGFCDLLLIRHPPGEQSFADIMQIKQNANRASNLVRQLLAFSRQQTLQPEVTDITDALAELSNLISRLIGENIELRMRHGRDIWPVRVDQGQFEQVIINLAVNARDSMTDGGSLTIRTNNIVVNRDTPLPSKLISSPQDEEIGHGEYVVIEIEDTGEGMPHDIMRKIFDPFFTTKGVGEGTGLGLSTVYGIIQQTGGHIYVTSIPGEGTKFSIYLKNCSDEEVGEEQEKIEVEEKKNVPADLTGRGTILLVEDEDPVRIFSSRALLNKGYIVLEASSGEDALEIIKNKGSEIDIIISDVVMPGITGPVMVEQVHQKYPDIKVIFISGYAEDTFIKTHGSNRKFNFLAKPFTLNQLATKVKETMERK